MNAEDLSTTTSACYYDLSLGKGKLNVEYLKDIKALRIYPDAAVKFSALQAIHFAAAGELNLCDDATF